MSGRKPEHPSSSISMSKVVHDVSRPLTGTTVVELGNSIAGPFASQILSDLGARVVKIEKAKGDDARHWGPPFVDGSAATFQAVNRSKRSVVADLRDPLQARALQTFITTHADVVVQNMRPGQVADLGLDASALCAINPRLVYCNMGAFGNRGPLANRPGYDPLMQAFGGIMSVVGEDGGMPVRVGPSIVDMGCGMWAAMGILSSLLARNLSGLGCVVDVSLFETAVGWMSMFSAQYLAGGPLPGKNGSGQVGIVPYRAYRTQDGDLVVAAGNDELFASLARVLGHPEWSAEPRFAANPQRVTNAEALYALIEPCFLQAGNNYWIAQLEAAGIPCAPVQNTAQMLAHPQTLAMDLLQQPLGSSIALVGLPIQFDGLRPQAKLAAPALGEAGSIFDLLATWSSD
jgi:crotonobetainyl-CoA:carnitine CoA-transferase CaiB-like acyl-CoA transferase